MEPPKPKSTVWSDAFRAALAAPESPFDVALFSLALRGPGQRATPNEVCAARVLKAIWLALEREEKGILQAWAHQAHKYVAESAPFQGNERAVCEPAMPLPPLPHVGLAESSRAFLATVVQCVKENQTAATMVRRLYWSMFQQFNDLHRQAIDDPIDGEEPLLIRLEREVSEKMQDFAGSRLSEEIAKLTLRAYGASEDKVQAIAKNWL